MAFDSIPRRAHNQARRRPEAPAYFAKSGGTWIATSWRGYVEEIRQVGKSLITLGLEAGDTTSILGFNRPEWTVFHQACMSVGGAPVGIYTTSSPDEIQYIMQHADSSIVLLEDEGQWRKIQQVRARLPALRHVVMMEGAVPIDDPMVISWQELLSRGDDVSDTAFDARLDALDPDQLATLIYTSGTTGPPKGVMLSHQNLCWTADACSGITTVAEEDCILSYLPLSHIAEQMFTIHGSATAGYAVYFAESIEKVADNLREVQPHLFFGVPRIWEKLQAGIGAKLEETAGFKRNLVSWAARVGKQVSELKCRAHSPNGVLRWQYALANRLVYSKLKNAIGMGRARICVSGAAPIPKHVLDFFAGFDIIVQEVYGQSEDSGPTSFNLHGNTDFRTVGVPIPGVTVRIADDGEILVKGPNVFLGYYKDPQATAETLVDGWLHSGDLGEIDSQGFLRITGRKKDIIITAGGKNIAPQNIEAMLKQSPLISEVTVFGDQRKYLTALVTLDPEASAAFASQHGINGQELHRHPKLLAAIQQQVDEANRHLARVETIKKFRVLPGNLSIENGELTPTLKVKRNVVYRRYAAEIDAMYDEDSA